MKISIITPSYNMARFIPATIESILSQAGPFELEHRVIDGGSDDGTLDILSNTNDPRFGFISEPDEGQSDAINKGIAQATGDVVAWLNADDLYEPGTLAAVAEAFGQAPEAKWLTGPVTIVDEDNHPIREHVTRYKNKRLRGYTYKHLLRENFISQPGTFWRCDAIAGDTPIDTTLNWAMDYDLWLRLGKLGDPVVLDHPLARFRLYAESKTGRFDRRQYDEDFAVAMRHTPPGTLRRLRRRLDTEKIVTAYRVMKILGK